MTKRHLIPTMTAVAVLVIAVHGSAQAPPGPSITGIAVDQTGGVLVGARVDLLASTDDPVQTFVTDSAGAFRFEGVAPGTYRVRAALDGFRTTTAGSPPAPARQGHCV